MSEPDSATNGPTIGIVGAGRTRQGLGPYLARWFELAGARVTGVSGRDFARSQAAAVAMAQQLHHPVVAFPSAVALAHSVDALVVACPVAGHLAGLDAALDAGIPCLCEKPLVAAADSERGLQLVTRFRSAKLALTENCQWPFALAAHRELHPERRARPVRAVAMRLSPASPGRAMIEDSLSHVLSLVQALVALPADAQLRSVVQSNPSIDAHENVVRFQIVGGIDDVRVELHLKCCPQQPRPAWYAVDGVRLNRQIADNYAISFIAESGRVANVQDPLGQLVYGFVSNLQARSQQADHRERTDALDTIALRIRLYRSVLARL